ncbi:DUF433 domain-containing protein [Paenibacillus donghaensis]|uniref:DUF433 domain-containing protein n=1 Tax=Paenibacillus donghaensis TaxID=414771 RepID=A0A2Z2KHH8_9BACL|nr:DUF433 domain-containing protein [Paenibacillus donghaensis]ASA22713.1 hypothetical protein B9T62_19090 [Paenibacillus donghaensis]
MNINEISEYSEFFNTWTPLEGYKYIGVKDGVCWGLPTIIGTRIMPRNIVCYGTVAEIVSDFDLTEEEVREALAYVAANEVPRRKSDLIRRGVQQ